MVPPSAALHRGRTSCQGLLLTASLLTFWNAPPCVGLEIVPEPLNVMEGDQVIFIVNQLPENLQGYRWFKVLSKYTQVIIAMYEIQSEIFIRGTFFTGRETIFKNGSLRIQNVTKDDDTPYLLQVAFPNMTTMNAEGRFFVYTRLPKPSLAVSNINPVENKDRITFTCSPERDDVKYFWWVKGENITGNSRLTLSLNRTILTIITVRRIDAGPYECQTWNPANDLRSNSVTLNVLYGPDKPVIYPPDTYFKSGTDIWLSCEVTSNPAASVSWLRNDNVQGNSKELLIPKSTTKHTGTYTCLAQNTGTGLITSTGKKIEILAPILKPFIYSENTISTDKKDTVVLTCVTKSTKISIQWAFNNHPLELSERKTLSLDNRTLSIYPAKMEDAGIYQCQVSNPMESVESDPFNLAMTNNLAQIRSTHSRWSIALMIYTALPLLLLLLLVLLLFMFLTVVRSKKEMGKEEKQLKKQKQQPEKGEAPKPPAGVNAQKQKRPAEKPLPQHPQKK